MRRELPSRISSFSPNKLKLGLFGSNCSVGRAATSVPERWSASWEDNLELAQMADDAGIGSDAADRPLARLWRRNQFRGLELGDRHLGLRPARADRRLNVFGTVHAPLVHPVYAAKQFVTADHIGRGRFGLNIVCGWNQDEFDMFGVDQRAHDDRYELRRRMARRDQGDLGER